MSFKSLFFLYFFPITLMLYHLSPLSWKRAILLVASYVFYMAWEPRYGALLLGTTIIDFYVAKKLETCRGLKKKTLLLSALSSHFLVLFSFKYFNFFNEIFNQPFSSIHLLLPVGLSFYTFQAIGYLLDVYKGEERAVQDFSLYAIFISYFPQLVAGPIERAKDLVPQLAIYRKPNSTDLTEAFQLMASGFFKKMVIADGLSRYVNHAFSDYGLNSPAQTTIGWLAFSMQVYGDFSGYSDIARGTALCLGHRLRLNFQRPYIATSFQELIQKLHMSLGDLFQRHVYIPLGGSRKGQLRTIINITIVMILSGLWHGSGYNFIAWGLSIAIFLVLEKILRLNKLPRMLGWFWAFMAWTITTMFFRIPNMTSAEIFIKNLKQIPSITSQDWFRSLAPFTGDGQFLYHALTMLFLCLALFIVENKEEKGPLPLLWSWTLVWLIIIFGIYDDTAFIYYQF